MVQAVIGTLCGTGLFFILADALKIPYFKTSRAVKSLSEKQKNKTSALDVILEGAAERLSKIIRPGEFRRQRLEADLRSAQMEITPEMFIANTAVKACLVGVFAVPAAFVFPLLCPVVLILSVFCFRRGMKAPGRRIRAKRQAIENELPRLVFTISKTLKHSRDVVYMLDTYRRNAGPEMKSELDITVADMQSGNIDRALNRLDARVGSARMSDVCRGLAAVVSGSDTAAYWASLEQTLREEQRQRLRLRARKVPKKVNRLSMCLLVCFMLTYAVVILDQIVSSLGILFG